jgi:hypothetical protein
MSATIQTSKKFGTLADFVSHRAAQMGPNREQLEAFAREFYCTLMQIINARENKFTLCSIMRFPHPPGFDLVSFCIWSILYHEWQLRLFSAELATLRKVRITWE